MDIGIGSYALFWEWHDHPEPLTIEAMIDRAAELGCTVFGSATTRASSPTTRPP